MLISFQKPPDFLHDWGRPLLFVGVLAGLLTVAGWHNYLLFHSLVEIFAVVVAFSVFAVFWNARRFLTNGFFVFLGIACLFVGILDLVHVLAYEGMAVIPGLDGNASIQAKTAGRWIAGLSFLVAPLFFRRKLNPSLVLIAYGILLGLVLGAIFSWRLFPDCFVAGAGTTRFEQFSRASCGVLFLSAIALLYYHRRECDRQMFGLLVASLAASAASEFTNALSLDLIGSSKVVAHLSELVCLCLMYKAFIEEGLKRPHDLMFRDLNRANFCIEQAGDCVLWTDSEARIVFANQKTCEVLGYSRDELQAMTVFDIDPVFPPRGWRDHWEEIKQRKSFVLESYHRTKTGHVFPVEVSVNYMAVDGQEYNCVFARDISDRKKAENHLAHFSAIVNSSQDAIIGGTLDGFVSSWNPGAERLYGYTADEMIGQPISTLLPPDRADEIARLKDGGRLEHYDTIRRRKDGTLVDVSITLSPIKNNEGTIIGASAIAHDITDRKGAEEMLRESETRLSGIIQNAAETIYTMSLDGVLTFVSPVWTQLLGHDVSEVEGQSFAPFIHPDDLAICQDAIKRCLTTGEPQHGTYRIRHKTEAGGGTTPLAPWSGTDKAVRLTS